MATGTRLSQAEVGVAVQTAEGTLAANPTFAHPLLSGLPKPVENTIEIPITELADDLVPGWHKTEQHWESDTTFWATPRATGAYLKLALGSLSTTGAADPFTHTFTRSASPPFGTLFATAPGTAYRKFGDGTCQELSFQFEAGMPVKLNTKFTGYTPSDLTAAYTATTTETIASSGNWFTMIGATFKRDGSTTPAATSVTDIRSGTITISRNVELIQSVTLNPSNRSLEIFRVGVALEWLFANYQEFKSTFYGSTTGTASSTTVVYGSLDFLFVQGPTTNANRTLQVQVPNVALRVPEPPDADPGGGPVMLSIVGVTAKPTTGEIATVILKSADSTY